MNYLKLFEAWVENPKFFRFNREEKVEGEWTPIDRQMWGSEEFNKCLVRHGFPDKKKCIHFMDSVAFNRDYMGVYGQYIYEITVDNLSNLGWCFVCPINDLFYKGNSFYESLRQGNLLLASIMETPFKDLSVFTEGDVDLRSELNEMVKYLFEFNLIGSGTIEDLKKSPHWGKEKLFVWTNDKVNIKKIDSPTKINKVTKSYKNEPVINSEDFLSKGIQSKEIGQFYQSEFGKTLKREQLGKEEALRLLDEWVKTR